jgi:hypothetical protein
LKCVQKDKVDVIYQHKDRYSYRTLGAKSMLQIRGFCERGIEPYDQLKTVKLLTGDSVLCTVHAKVLVLEGQS